MIFALLLLNLCKRGSTSEIRLLTEIKNVKLYSVNLRTVLRWDPVYGSAAAYFVQYKILGDNQWQNITDCWGTFETSCDLTLETSKPENAYEYHIARVRAETASGPSKWTETDGFHPIFDINIDPPTVELTSRQHSISINIIAPLALLRAKFRISQSAKKGSKKKIQYIIIVSAITELQKTYVTDENMWNITNLTPGTCYCISAKIEVVHINKTSHPSKEQCITLEGVKTKEIILGSVVPAVAILFLACLSRIYCKLNKYASHPQIQLPSALNLPGEKPKKESCFKEKKIVVPFIYEKLETVKYILEVKLNNCSNEMWDNRYVSKIQLKEEYINEDYNMTAGNIELHNPTYIKCFDESNHTSVLPTQGTSSPSMQELEESLLQSLAKPKNAVVYANLNKPTQPHHLRLPCINKNESYANCSIVEDPFQGKWGLCLQGGDELQESYCATSVSYAGLSSTLE
ncbi:interleukin-20 receptor subunit alpha-like [Rhinatrema bivittatum]|uniref:interleukin-20 receptor subunit alpha-like n=1 Tax=Rhinatrema bivittatum TaxID=194408 RepID=UPI00112D5914|nr:interleukin-20 receptor subunit alpha-like [Rhinatrema bivittatum]